jgi:hypothetical protein
VTGEQDVGTRDLTPPDDDRVIRGEPAPRRADPVIVRDVRGDVKQCVTIVVIALNARRSSTLRTIDPSCHYLSP